MVRPCSLGVLWKLGESIGLAAGCQIGDLSQCISVLKARGPCLMLGHKKNLGAELINLPLGRSLPESWGHVISSARVAELKMQDWERGGVRHRDIKVFWLKNRQMNEWLDGYYMQHLLPNLVEFFSFSTSKFGDVLLRTIPYSVGSLSLYLFLFLPPLSCSLHLHIFLKI